MTTPSSAPSTLAALVHCACHEQGGGGPFDPLRLRKDFPILTLTVHKDKTLAYLDNAATTQKPASVVCVLCEYYQACNANVHRSLHYLAEQATLRFEEARRKVQRFIGAPSERSVIFTRGTTEGINLVAQAWGRRNLKPNDEVVLTGMEHHSNLVPWQLVAKETGAKLKFVPVLDDGALDLDAYGRLLKGRVRLAAFTHISNVLGTVNPVKQMTAMAHAAGALVLVDAAQSVPNRPVNVADIDCDFLAFSGHKMLGPTGIGVLYGRLEILERMEPFLAGGEMINRVTLEESTWADLPQKFEAGTPHVSGAIGLGVAVDYLQRVGMETIRAYDEHLARSMIARLDAIPGVRVFGRAPERGGAVSFEVEGVHPHDLAQFCDKDGIAIRAGHLCAQPLMQRFGVPAVSRASVYFYNVEEELDRLVQSILKAKAFFHGA
ncbi:MAG TPA: cysteine desulfurase [Kiritimatiellia bacterium]|nr:cysteine desulfurase [Kiritimatiellia bacterium]HRZ12212.1 cysteine desulfurase [Kiritimatiellia bacterium]HSA18030.1 cysteine desulfurase [Kiritimatiellia bacterium]